MNNFRVLLTSVLRILVKKLKEKSTYCGYRKTLKKVIQCNFAHSVKNLFLFNSLINAPKALINICHNFIFVKKKYDLHSYVRFKIITLLYC